MAEPLSYEDMKDLPYVMKVWKETCRIHPVGFVINRRASKNLKPKGRGIEVHKGTDVLALFRRGHLDSGVWRDPHAFVLERWGTGSEMKAGNRVPAGAHVPFGLGPFNYAGRFLADYQGPLVLVKLRRRFKFSLACGPHEVKKFTSFVDSAKYLKKETLVIGVPVHVQLRTAG